MLVKNVEELTIYQIALQFATEIVCLIKDIPRYWNISECNQILRSSSSVHANITEGFSHRFYPKQFIRYLSIAIGSSDETKNHLEKLYKDRYIKTEIASNFIKKYKNLSVRMVNFRNYLRKRHNIT